MKRTLILHALLLVAVLMLCSRPSFAGDTSSGNLSGKKVLWVDSYHKGYGWSNGIEAGVRKGLAGSGVTLDLIRMDTKRVTDAKSLQSVGLKVLEKVEAFHPDVIIASDDAAQKYAVVPHLLQKSIPIVFVGVNWDASIYGYPRHGVTGMVEVYPIATLVSHMRTLAKGTRYAIIASDNLSENKDLKYHREQVDVFPDGFTVVMAKNYEDFQTEFLRLQESHDAIIFNNVATIPGWDAKRAQAWLFKNTKVITGSNLEFLSDSAVITVARLATEQGEYGAKTALRILRGTAAETIPLVTNQQTRLVLNHALAARIGVVFPMSLLRAAKQVTHD